MSSRPAFLAAGRKRAAPPASGPAKKKPKTDSDNNTGSAKSQLKKKKELIPFDQWAPVATLDEYNGSFENLLKQQRVTRPSTWPSQPMSMQEFTYTAPEFSFPDNHEDTMIHDHQKTWEYTILSKPLPVIPVRLLWNIKTISFPRVQAYVGLDSLPPSVFLYFLDCPVSDALVPVRDFMKQQGRLQGASHLSLVSVMKLVVELINTDSNSTFTADELEEALVGDSLPVRHGTKWSKGVTVLKQWVWMVAALRLLRSFPNLFVEGPHNPDLEIATPIVLGHSTEDWSRAILVFRCFLERRKAGIAAAVKTIVAPQAPPTKAFRVPMLDLSALKSLSIKDDSSEEEEEEEADDGFGTIYLPGYPPSLASFFKTFAGLVVDLKQKTITNRAAYTTLFTDQETWADFEVMDREDQEQWARDGISDTPDDNPATVDHPSPDSVSEPDFNELAQQIGLAGGIIPHMPNSDKSSYLSDALQDLDVYHLGGSDDDGTGADDESDLGGKEEHGDPQRPDHQEEENREKNQEENQEKNLDDHQDDHPVDDIEQDEEMEQGTPNGSGQVEEQEVVAPGHASSTTSEEE